MYFDRPPGWFPGSFLHRGGIALVGQEAELSTGPNAAMKAFGTRVPFRRSRA